MQEKKLGYKRDILRNLYFAGSLSCAELSDQIDKSLPLTTKMLNDLMTEGWVVEKGHAPSTGGRRPLQYSLKPDTMYILSVAMDQFVTRIAILDMHNRYLTGIEKFELPLSKNPQALSQLAEKLEQVIVGSNIPRDKIIGIGIGMPGFVDAVKGINYSFLEIPNGSITEYIAAKLELPVFINNDSSLIALAELKFGAARNRKTAMVINIGWGIGLGLVINGELYQGENGFAGEFSHIPLFLHGKLCSCGKRGCLETESSLLVVLEKAREGLQAGRQSVIKELSAEHLEQAIESVITAAGKGDQFMIELLSDAGYTIGRGVAVLIHVLNPEVIILSGRGASPGIIWQTPIQQALNEHCIPRLAASTSIEISNLGYNAEIIGAAALVMENCYQLRHIPALTT
ncbi:MAG TPA: ROK family protein [Puia sp.]|nr:ROK family protein [Puia sp.]